MAVKEAASRLLLALIALGTSSTYAQTPPGGVPQPAPAPAVRPAWEAELDFSLSPRIGREEPLDFAEDPVNESEAEMAFAVRRPRVIWKLPLEVRVGLTHSPRIFDGDEPASSFYAQMTLGDNWFPLHRLVTRATGATASAGVADAFEDRIRPYARYRYTSFYDGLVDAYKRNEHQITGGVRLRNVVTVECDRAMPAPAPGEALCSDQPGVYFEARVEASRIWSSDPMEERFVPQARLELVSRRLVGGTRLFGRAHLDASFYDHARVPVTNERREEWRMRLTGGIDLSELLGRFLPGARAELAGQFQRRWSSDPGRRHTRFYLVPAIGYTLPF